MSLNLYFQNHYKFFYLIKLVKYLKFLYLIKYLFTFFIWNVSKIFLRIYKFLKIYWKRFHFSIYWYNASIQHLIPWIHSEISQTKILLRKWDYCVHFHVTKNLFSFLLKASQQDFIYFFLNRIPQYYKVFKIYSKHFHFSTYQYNVLV